VHNTGNDSWPGILIIGLNAKFLGPGTVWPWHKSQGHLQCSGGARVFIARLCCHPCTSDQSCNQGIFQNFGHGLWTNPWVSYSSAILTSLPSPLPFRYYRFPPRPLPSFRNGPLKYS